MSTTTGEVREVVQQIVGRLSSRQLAALDAAIADDGDGVVMLAERIARNPRVTNPPAVFCTALDRGDYKRRARAVPTDETTGTVQPARVPAAEALRRLYDAKVAELQRYGLPEAKRIPLAVDYACGEIHRCSIQPMPAGGLGRLEDDLYRALGYDRTTGLRHAPQTRA